MHEPTYRRALGRAAQLVFHHKILWVFGVLSLLLGQIGWNNFIGGLAIFSSEPSSVGSYFVGFPWSAMLQGQNIVWSIWLLLIIAAVSAFVILIAVVSEGALIAAATGWYNGAKQINIDEAWKRGVKHFVRLFGLHVLKKIVLVALLGLVNLLIWKTVDQTSISASLFTIFVITVGVLFALLISTVGIFAAGYVVEGEMPVWDSVKEGFELFKNHVLVSFELSLIFLFIQVGAIAILFAFATWFLLPFVSFSVMAGLTGATGLVMTGLFSSLALFFIAAAFLGGVLNSYMVSAWMYLFMKMHHEGIPSRILHFLRLKRV